MKTLNERAHDIFYNLFLTNIGILVLSIIFCLGPGSDNTQIRQVSILTAGFSLIYTAMSGAVSQLAKSEDSKTEGVGKLSEFLGWPLLILTLLLLILVITSHGFVLEKLLPPGAVSLLMIVNAVFYLRARWVIKRYKVGLTL